MVFMTFQIFLLSIYYLRLPFRGTHTAIFSAFHHTELSSILRLLHLTCTHMPSSRLCFVNNKISKSCSILIGCQVVCKLINTNTPKLMMNIKKYYRGIVKLSYRLVEKISTTVHELIKCSKMHSFTQHSLSIKTTQT